ncbi:serine protease gd-like [Sitodiplosis mosellana]|uniref:serine protease gd-like n=1 Tax=Sitodiplosis mosellana TaxID=263140 RepID=UPI0024441547|nr:serine protease gd-like [Sitodiplosis mosellana]
MFRVTFPYRNPIPKVVRIVYDNQLLCTGPEEQPSPQSVVSRIDLKHVMNTYTNFQPSNMNNIYNFDHNFNKPNYASNFGGQYTPQQYSPSNTMNSYPMLSSSFPNQGIMTPAYTVALRPTAVPTIRTTTTEMPSYEISPVLNTDLNTICGTRHSETEITPLIFGGEETQRGDWPWMVAIYLNKATGLSFNCGGTLISAKTVITAAHCLNTSTKNYRAQEVVLYLGRYSLIDWSEVGSIATNVDQIIIHTDYKRQRESFDADIAILVMTKQIEFNEFVRPACLWPGTVGIQEIEGKNGVVVGWGKDGTDRVVSNIPKKVNLPIVNSITCVQTSESLSKAVSNRTFCAGTLNGDGPCHGDSGGGLTHYHNDRWTLRGSKYIYIYISVQMFINPQTCTWGRPDLFRFYSVFNTFR